MTVKQEIKISLTTDQPPINQDGNCVYSSIIGATDQYISIRARDIGLVEFPK